MIKQLVLIMCHKKVEISERTAKCEWEEPESDKRKRMCSPSQILSCMAHKTYSFCVALYRLQDLIVRQTICNDLEVLCNRNIAVKREKKSQLELLWFDYLFSLCARHAKSNQFVPDFKCFLVRQIVRRNKFRVTLSAPIPNSKIFADGNNLKLCRHEFQSFRCAAT